MKKLALLLAVVLMFSVFPLFTFAAEITAPEVTDPELLVWSEAQTISSGADDAAKAAPGAEGMTAFQVAYDADYLYVRVTLSRVHTAVYVFINTGDSVNWYAAKINDEGTNYVGYPNWATNPVAFPMEKECEINGWTTSDDNNFYVVDMKIPAPVALEDGATISLDVHVANWGTQGSGVWAWSATALNTDQTPNVFGTVTLAAAQTETPSNPDPVEPAPGEDEEEGDDTTAEVPVVGGTSQNVTASTVYEAPVYGAEITWGALTFEYTKSTNTWASTVEDGDKITVTNTTKDGVALDVSFTYTQAEDFDNISGSFTGVDATNRIGQGEDVTATLVLAGQLPRGTANATIGSVTVTLTAVPEE